MNCRRLQESLGDYSVGLLEHTALTDFERHASLCAECAKSVRQFRRCLELLNHSASPAPPDELWLGVHARLELERAATTHIQQARQVPARRPWRSGIVATALGFATAAVVMIGFSSDRPASTDVADMPPSVTAATADDVWPRSPYPTTSFVRASESAAPLTGYSSYQDLFLPERMPALEVLPKPRRDPRSPATPLMGTEGSSVWRHHRERPEAAPGIPAPPP